MKSISLFLIVASIFGASAASLPEFYAKAPIATGLGITNINNVVSNNIMAGSGVSITAGANGQETIAATGSGGSAPVGTMVSDGSTFVAGTVPIAKDTTGTNFTGTATLTITSTNASFKGTVFVDNLVATNGITLGSGSTNLSVTGNVLANGGVFTNTLTIGGVAVSTATTTDTFQNKTYDAAATGNTLKFKSYIPLLTPGFADGIGAIPNTNDYTVATFGHYKFSGSAATNANYVVYGPISVPTDIDTSVDLRARLKVRLSATETSASTFNLGVQDVADSASGSFAGSGNWVAVAISADASGAANDLETSAWITLTGWKSALTADHAMFIVLNRDGAGDSANTGIWEAELKIEYGVTQ